MSAISGGIDGFRIINDRCLVSWSENNLEIWDLDLGDNRRLSSVHQDQIIGIYPLASGFISWNNREIHRWNLETLETTSIAVEDDIEQLIVTRDHELIAWQVTEPETSWDKRTSVFYIWHLDSPRLCRRLHWRGSFAGYSPETGKLLLEDADSDELKTFNGLKGGRYLNRFGIYRGADDSDAERRIGIPGVAFHLQEDLFLFSGNCHIDGVDDHSPVCRYEVWDVSAAACLLKGEEQNGLVAGARMENRRLLVWKENSLVIRDLDQKTVDFEFSGHSADILHAHFLPGNRLISCSSRELFVHDLDSGSVINALAFPMNNLHRIEQISDNRATLLFNQSLRLINLDLSKLPETDDLVDEQSAPLVEKGNEITEPGGDNDEKTESPAPDQDPEIVNSREDEDFELDEDDDLNDDWRNGGDSADDIDIDDDLDIDDPPDGRVDAEKDISCESISGDTATRKMKYPPTDRPENEKSDKPEDPFHDLPDNAITRFFKALYDLPPEIADWSDLSRIENTALSSFVSKLRDEPETLAVSGSRHRIRGALFDAAVLAEDDALVRLLLIEGKAFTQKEINGELRKAIKVSKTEAVELLLSVADDIRLLEGESISVLSQAARLGRNSLIPLILAHPSLDNAEIIRAFLWSAIEGHHTTRTILAGAIQALEQDNAGELVSMAENEDFSGIINIFRESGQFRENQLFSLLAENIHNHFIDRLFKLYHIDEAARKDLSEERDKLVDCIKLNYPDLDAQAWEELQHQGNFRRLQNALEFKKFRCIAQQPLSEFQKDHPGNCEFLVNMVIVMTDIFKVYKKNALAVEDALPSLENEIYRSSLIHLIALHADYFPPVPELIASEMQTYLDRFITEDSNLLYEVIQTGLLQMAADRPFEEFMTAILDLCDWNHLLEFYQFNTRAEHAAFLRSYLENRFPTQFREFETDESRNENERTRDEAEATCNPIGELDETFKERIFESYSGGRVEAVHRFCDNLEEQKRAEYPRFERVDWLEYLQTLENDISGPLADDFKKDIQQLLNMMHQTERDILVLITQALGDEKLRTVPFLTNLESISEIQNNREARKQKLIELTK